MKKYLVHEVLNYRDALRVQHTQGSLLENTTQTIVPLYEAISESLWKEFERLVEILAKTKDHYDIPADIDLKRLANEYVKVKLAPKDRERALSIILQKLGIQEVPKVKSSLFKKLLSFFKRLFTAIVSVFKDVFTRKKLLVMVLACMMLFVSVGVQTSVSPQIEIERSPEKQNAVKELEDDTIPRIVIDVDSPEKMARDISKATLEFEKEIEDSLEVGHFGSYSTEIVNDLKREVGKTREGLIRVIESIYPHKRNHEFILYAEKLEWVDLVFLIVKVAEKAKKLENSYISDAKMAGEYDARVALQYKRDALFKSKFISVWIKELQMTVEPGEDWSVFPKAQTIKQAIDYLERDFHPLLINQERE